MKNPTPATAKQKAYGLKLETQRKLKPSKWDSMTSAQASARIDALLKMSAKGDGVDWTNEIQQAKENPTRARNLFSTARHSAHSSSHLESHRALTAASGSSDTRVT